MASITVNDQLVRQNLAGRTAIVTGGASGIGKATVKALHSNGANVVIADLLDVNGEKLASSLGPERAKYVRTNILVWSDMCNLFKVATTSFSSGRIDIVIANAGLMEHQDFLHETIDANGDLAEPNYAVLDVNLKGCLSTTKLALYHFKHQLPSGGNLVLVSSISGYVGGRDVLQYKASKHGVIGVLRGASRHAPDINASVTAIAPYMTKTHMTTGFSDEWQEAGIPSNEPSDVALACVVAATHPNLNGCTLWIAGGKISEVEQGYQKSVPQWLGEENWNILQRGSALLGKGYKLPPAPRKLDGL